MSKSKKQNAIDHKKALRNNFSHPAAREFYKFIEQLDPEIIIMAMQCKLNPYGSKSYIKASLARPYINSIDNVVEDYDTWSIRIIWDKKGALIKREVIFPEEN